MTASNHAEVVRLLREENGVGANVTLHEKTPLYATLLNGNAKVGRLLDFLQIWECRFSLNIGIE